MTITDPTPSEAELAEKQQEQDIDDDFLFHLYQGGELLRTNQVERARAHIEQAFTLRPANPRGQNLLGLMYYKLGLLDQAIEVYSELVERFRKDATLRVNLAMVYIRAEKLEEAELQLRQAIELSPDHQNAHRYLGLVLSRTKRTEQAQAHLTKAGVKGVRSPIDAPGGETSVDEAQQNERPDQTVTEVNKQRFIPLTEHNPIDQKSNQIRQQVDAPQETSALDSSTLEIYPQAKDSEDQPQPEIPAQESLEGLDLEQNQQPEVFSLQAKSLVSRCPGRLYSRLCNLSWYEGDLAYHPVRKRFGGQETKHLFDRGSRAMTMVQGQGWIFAEPAQGEFHILQHFSEAGYFREDLVYAFANTPSWENGRLPCEGADDLPIFHVFGNTQVVLLTPGTIRRRTLAPNSFFRIRVDKFVGWRGSLVPRLSQSVGPLPDSQLWLNLEGAGEILYIQ